MKTASSPLVRCVLTALAAALLGAAVSWTAEPKSPPGPPLDADHAAKMARGLELFKKQVRPVLVKSCVGCHGDKKTESGLDLSDRDGLLRGGESGPAILVGRA